MKSWSGIRKTLEQDRLAPSLQGRVRYLATRYRGAHDDMGRIALLIDGQEVFSAHPFQAPSVDWAGLKEQHPDLSCEERAEKYWNLSLEEGIGDRGDFYRAFREYDTQDVAASLQSEDPLVRVLAGAGRAGPPGGKTAAGSPTGSGLCRRAGMGTAFLPSPPGSGGPVSRPQVGAEVLAQQPAMPPVALGSPSGELSAKPTERV